ncbi:3045_t:CDS:2 [Acaulospora colombiana]|uniref:3045_t:CDS:1 n=1 Tax=Acaulospora colombiana TaxID=27376 RepID=A0ACA9KQM1_9GLOM|nr:3045_t:CDS:2 [Acaulospora colombiana]
MERNDYVGITIGDDFSQRQLPSMPAMVTSSSPSRSHHQQHQLNTQNPHRQDFLDGHNRRRSINYIQSSSGHYPSVPSPQNQNPSQHQRSLSAIAQATNTYQTAYSNSQPPSPSNHFPNVPNSNKPSQPSSLTTRDRSLKPESCGTAFRRIRSKSDLRPPPAPRRTDSAKGAISPLKSLTVHLTSTYHKINPKFRYELSCNPRRVLTKPSKGVKNDGYDNEDNDYILYVNDILGSEEGQKYLILDILGQGTFGQVVKCQNLKTKETVAVKVVKNKPAYFNQSMMEVTILELLNNTWDSQDQHHILRLLDTFIHRRHLCLVFELLSVNLYELIKQNQFRGLSTNLVRVFTAQLLDALTVLNEARIIHCDLKPENVLLKKWSSEYNQVSRIVEMLGVPPPYMIEVGKTDHEYFDRYINEHGQKKYRLKTMEQYMKDNNCVEQPSKRYFSATTLPEIIRSYPIMRKGVTQKDVEKEMQNRLAFIDFVQGLLNLNPIERWSPQQAKLHPFITGEKFTGKFVPPMQLKSPSKVSASSAQALNASQPSSSHLPSMTSPSQYKAKTNTSPNTLHKSSVTSHEVPSVTVAPHVTSTKGSTTSQRQQASGKLSTLAPKSSVGSLRPRASTIGNIQVPPQIQRAAALVSPGNVVGGSPGEHSRLPREKDFRRLPQPYPHLNLLKGHDQTHDVPQFSVVVEGEDRRALGPSLNLNAPTTEVVGIRIGEDWIDEEGRHQKEKGSPKDEGQQNVMSDDIGLSTNESNDRGAINNNNGNEKRLKVMPGSMPNGDSTSPVISSGLDDDTIVDPLGTTLHLTQQYHKKSQTEQQGVIGQNSHNNNNSWQPSSTSKSQRSILPQHHYQQSGLRHPSPLSAVSVNVASPLVNQTPTRVPNYHPSSSYSSSFRTPNTSPYTSQTHQHVLPPPVTQQNIQQASSATTSGSYYQNLVPPNYEQYHHNMRTHRRPSNHRISPSTSPYPSSSPSNYDLPPSPTPNHHLPPQSSYYRQQSVTNNHRSSPSKTGPHEMLQQQSTLPSITNSTVNSDSLPSHLNNNHDAKYNNQREINTMPYQMA